MDLSLLEDFEKEYGIKVNVSTFSSNEDMLAKVKSEDEGTYDIVQPSDYMVESMIAQGMLEKLDQDALTNLSNIGSQYLDQCLLRSLSGWGGSDRSQHRQGINRY